ncbi:hypothetical protein AA313_de0201351 [Arthrobotrys entomopaga]|nr:hypothetical protein AA313_de0201351 [Arthrobotrys entomopaga]
MASRVFSRSRAYLPVISPRPYRPIGFSHRLYSIKPTTLETTPATPKVGIEQDHHYSPSTATSSTSTSTSTSTPAASSVGSDLNVRQASSKARTLPDGTIPAIHSGSRNAVEGDDVIPSITSDGPSPENSQTLNADTFSSRRGVHTIENAHGELKPAAAGTPSHLHDGVNSPEFTDTSSKVDETSSKVLKEMKDHTSSNPLYSPHPYTMNASPVPSSRIGRLFHYGGLAAGMTLGALNESIKRATTSSDSSSPSGGLVLNPQNIERLVKTLSKMRGAALKLGQMLSFQDSNFLPPPIQLILSRVQNQADYMPASQRDTVLKSNLGADWRTLFKTFDETPIAAASIGQVHTATLASTGEKVAIKIQYPGVATSISSDLNNLSILLTATRLLPKGLFLDKTIANARTELAWECDYIREAQAQTKFSNLITTSPSESKIFTVPKVIPEASGPEVLTMEFMSGEPVTRLPNLSQQERDWLGTHILRLCLLEIVRWNFMQTDPNWSNFLYNPSTDLKKIELLDFGASREFPREFIDSYVGVLKAAAVGDAPTIRELSIKLGYLTGLESQAMLEAHILSIVTLAEPFRRDAPAVYDFGAQTVTDRVKALIPVMVRERLRPPPEETYSLHRKLSGAFLLCARLGSRVQAREMFEEVVG